MYDRQYYSGRSLKILGQNSNFGNDYFSNRVESIRTYGNCQWLFYDYANFRGSSHVLRGSYYSAARWGVRSNSISSARALPPSGTVAIALFQHANYQGRMVILKATTARLHSIDFNDNVSSMIVLGGTWKLFEQVNCRGRYITLRTGRCPDVRRQFNFNNRISSVQKLSSSKLQLEEELQMQ